MTLACLDLETHLIAPGAVFPRIVLGAVDDGRGGVVLGREDVLDWAQGVLNDPPTAIVNHAIGFDMGCLGAARPELLPAIFQAYADDRICCTYMLAQLADIGMYGTNKGGLQKVSVGHFPCDTPFEKGGRQYVNLPSNGKKSGAYTLQNQARRWLDIDLVKDETRTTFAEYDGVPVDQIPERYRTYVLGDLCARDLWSAIHAAADWDLSNVYALSRRDFALRLIEARGRYTDPVQVAKQRVKWEAELAEAFTDLRDQGFLVETRGPRKKYYMPAGWSKPTAARKQWAQRWGLKSLTETALTKALGEGEVSPRRASLVIDYLSDEHRTAKVSPARQRFFRRAGLWKQKQRVRYELGDGTGEFKMKQAPVQAYAEDFAKRTNHDFERTPTGKIKIIEENAHEDELLTKVVTYSRARTIRTYLERLEAGAVRPMHMRVNGLAETGRTTSGGGQAGINDQNHRRGYGFRECFIPRKRYGFLSVDYAQIELCCLAEVQYAWFGESDLGDQINAGKDCHLAFAARVAGVTYEEAAANKKAFKDGRQLGKVYNFGRPGGLAERKFIEWAWLTYKVVIPYSEWSHEAAEGFELIPDDHLPKSMWLHALPPELQERAKAEAESEEEGDYKTIFHVDSDPAEWDRVRTNWVQAQSRNGRVWCKARSFGHLNSLWMAEFRQMKPYLEKVQSIIQENDGLVYQHKTGRRRAACTYTNAANGYFQALNADGATEALFRVQWACYAKPESPLYGCAAVWFVHDEIGLEALLDRFHEAAYECVRIMEETMREFVTRVKVKAIPAGCRRWTKSADDARIGPSGRLIPEEDYRLQNASLETLGKDAWAAWEEYERADVQDLFRRYRLELMT
jgi:hypothetical protein